MPRSRGQHSHTARPTVRQLEANRPHPPQVDAVDLSQLEHLPTSYQELDTYYNQLREAQPFKLRLETLKRIERVTNRPLLCYVTKTRDIPQGIASFIDDSDLIGFSDLINSINGDSVDLYIVSNGGSAEATERIVRMLRERFHSIRFILPSNAYSAATLLSFCGEEIIMGPQSTLGPIDPQLNGIPARAILRAFETLQKTLADEGPSALTAYMPLVMKYDLHILEMCRSMETFSKELARTWLSTYVFCCEEGDPAVSSVVDYFSDYDRHHTHGRSIGRAKAKELGLKITYVEDIPELDPLILSLHNQYEIWFNKTAFYKNYENAHGICWGRQAQQVSVQVPLMQPAL